MAKYWAPGYYPEGYWPFGYFPDEGVEVPTGIAIATTPAIQASATGVFAEEDDGGGAWEWPESLRIALGLEPPPPPEPPPAVHAKGRAILPVSYGAAGASAFPLATGVGKAQISALSARVVANLGVVGVALPKQFPNVQGAVTAVHGIASLGHGEMPRSVAVANAQVGVAGRGQGALLSPCAQARAEYSAFTDAESLELAAMALQAMGFAQLPPNITIEEMEELAMMAMLASEHMDVNEHTRTS